VSNNTYIELSDLHIVYNHL